MPKPKPFSNGLPDPLKDSPTATPRKKPKQKSGPRPYRLPHTPAKSEKCETLKRAWLRLDRRGMLLARLGLTSEQVDGAVQVTSMFRRIGVKPERLIEVLQADSEPESVRLVAIWSQLTPAQRNILKLEGLALAGAMTPRRLWELYCGANMMQSREAVGAMICEALPSVMKKTVKLAQGGKYQAMEHIYKAARVLPTPKGSVINIGVPSGKDSDSEDRDELTDGRTMEGADDFLMRASRAMGAKQLPAPVIEAEDDEEEEEDDDDGL